MWNEGYSLIYSLDVRKTMKKHLYSITGASHGMGLAMAQQLMRAAKLGETRVETCLWRDGACQTPSYWSTRNRSIDKRPTGQQKL